MGIVTSIGTVSQSLDHIGASEMYIARTPLVIANAEVAWSVSLIFFKLAANISRWKACNRDRKVHRFKRENWQYVNKFNGWLDGE